MINQPDSRFVSLTFAITLALGCLGDSSGAGALSATVPTVSDRAAITVESVGPDLLVGVANLAGTMVRFQARRGAPTPREIVAGDPDASEFEIDARFVSANGDTFAARIGGHTFSDPQWITEANAFRGAVDEAARQRDFAAARAAADALEAEASIAVAADLRDAVVALARSEASGPSNLVPIAPSNGSGVATAISAVTAQTYTHAFEIRWKYVSIRGIPTPTQHSSTRTTSRAASGVPMYVRITCNHGACANALVNLGCSTTFFNRQAPLPPFPTCGTAQVGENYSSYGCCASAYSITAPGHLCHDDTRFQRDAIRVWPSTIGYPSYCNDSSYSWFAPSCW